jgi:hypothetical protein
LDEPLSIGAIFEVFSVQHIAAGDRWLRSPQDRGATLAQPVRCAMGQGGLIVMLAEPISETVGGKRLAKVSDEKR